jgi:hypothetical protein
MLVSRLLTPGLCIACVVLLATFEPVRIEVGPAGTMAAMTPVAAHRDREPRLSVVDVAAGVAPSAIFRLIGLGPREWISAINDRPVGDDAEADALISSLARPGRFLDVAVSSARAERRVLVLVR